MGMGFKFLKMDVGIGLLEGNIPGALIAPRGMLDNTGVMHQFTGIQITDQGIAILKSMWNKYGQSLAMRFRWLWITLGISASIPVSVWDRRWTSIRWHGTRT